MKSSHRGTAKAPGHRVWASAAAAVGVALVLALATPHVAGAVAGSSNDRAKLEMLPGPDSSASCSSYPCATVTTSGVAGAKISLTLGIASLEAHQPETYYTDLLQVTNPTSAGVTVTAVTLGGLTETRPGDFGAVTVDFCAHQTNDPGEGCEGAFTASSTSGGFVFRGDDVIPPGGSRYIEIEGFAGAMAHVGDAIGFTIGVTAE